MGEADESEAPAAIDAVLASYARCRERGGFLESFYAQLWARDPRIAERFEGTDMERQHAVMREGINTLLMFARGSAVAGMALGRIARVHAHDAHDVTPNLYAAFIDVLVATAKVWDPQWTSVLDGQWRDALRPGIAFMVERR